MFRRRRRIPVGNIHEDKERITDLEFDISLVPLKALNEFTVSFEGLSEIIDELWEKFHSTMKKGASDDFEIIISKSCFSYYIWQHVYARIVNIKYLHRTLNNIENIHTLKTYFRYIQACPIPYEIVKYLSSMGDIKDQAGLEFILDFPIYPNERGNFGRVSKDTHYMYETMAAPLVLAQRIMQDLAYTRNEGEERWNLLAELVPIERSAGLPTKNLLGWDLSQKLNSSQRELIESAGITTDNFNSSFCRFMWNRRLFKKIRCVLERSGLAFNYVENQFGSHSQIPWIHCKRGATFSRERNYADTYLNLITSCKLNQRVLNEASAFCFRVRKDKVGSLDSYCCYDFNCYKNVPESWRITRNTLFEYGDVSFWNLPSFRRSLTRYKSVLPRINLSRRRYALEAPVFERSMFSKKFFTITFEGLQGIIDEFYNLLVVNKPSLTNSLARSVFSYYIWMILFVVLAEKRNSQEYEVNLGIIPLPIQKYINAIGNFDSRLGIDLKIHFPVWPNVKGHFGQITEDTHYLYETMAAPVVLAQRIMEDLAYTQNPNGVRTWNVRDISPDEKNAGLPTKNLIGWDLREKLTIDQETILKIAGITTDNFPNEYQRFMYNKALVDAVSRILGKYLPVAENTNVNISAEGSVCQMLWVKREESVEEEEVFNRLIQYSERPLKQICFSLQNTDSIIASLVCSFRVRKDTVGNLDSYCCYDFNGYQEVPDAWKETRNIIFKYGDVDIWNVPKFVCGSFAKEYYRRSWLRKLVGLIN